MLTLIGSVFILVIYRSYRVNPSRISAARTISCGSHSKLHSKTGVRSRFSTRKRWKVLKISLMPRVALATEKAIENRMLAERHSRAHAMPSVFCMLMFARAYIYIGERRARWPHAAVFNVPPCRRCNVANVFCICFFVRVLFASCVRLQAMRSGS